MGGGWTFVVEFRRESVRERERDVTNCVTDICSRGGKKKAFISFFLTKR